MSQLTLPTALQWVFDPSAGVGCGLNLLGLFSSSRWPAHVVLGWSLSKGLWKWLGAEPPAKLSVPIDVKARRSRRDKPTSRDVHDRPGSKITSNRCVIRTRCAGPPLRSSTASASPDNLSGAVTAPARRPDGDGVPITRRGGRTRPRLRPVDARAEREPEAGADPPR